MSHPGCYPLRQNPRRMVALGHHFVSALPPGFNWLPPALPPVPSLASGTYWLQTSPLRGYDHYGDPVHLATLRLGERLTLQAEPANPHDTYAVRVHHQGRHIGYLPRESNHVVSRLLRQGAPLGALIAWLDPAGNPQLPLTLHVIWITPTSGVTPS